MSYRGANEVRVLRRRLEDLESDVGRRGDGPDTGAPVLVGKTSTDGAYPVAINAFYKVELYLTGGELKEGAVPVFTDLNMSEYAVNLGTAVPPLGTLVRIDLLPGGTFGFSYSG